MKCIQKVLLSEKKFFLKKPDNNKENDWKTFASYIYSK